jgi:photoactive yellow protein
MNSLAYSIGSLDFLSPDILSDLESASQPVKDAAQFGIVQMHPDGVVAYYGPWEAARAGLSSDRVLGRHFFREVAPCANNLLVAQRFQEEAELDVVINYVFTFRMRVSPVKLRLLKSARSAHQYLLVQRA